MEYRTRLIDGLLERVAASFPALLVVGPRGCGKTTTATRHAAKVVRLDIAAEANAMRADPAAVLKRLPEPVLLDEWQVVPEVLGAIKRTVDTDPRGRRFLLTGSVTSELEAWSGPATGRVIRLEMFGLTVRERLGRLGRAPFLERIMAGEDPASPDALDLGDYVDLALAGGFPEPVLNRPGADARRWLQTYAAQLTQRDPGRGAAGAFDPAKMRRYVEALAANSAGLVQDRTLYESAGITRMTAAGYETLLTRLHVLQLLPAWFDNRLKRLVKSPKRYLVDSGLAAAILGLDADGVLSDGDALGRLLDTFVVSQLRAELDLTVPRPRLHHLRAEQGRREIDLVIEMPNRRVIGIEIKASAAPTPESARHLAWLRDSLGERFVAGLVLHTGAHTWSLGDRLTAAPISSIWAP